MCRTLYMMNSGELRRKDNTIVVETESGKRYLPVETSDEIIVFGDVSLNKRFLEFCTKTQIMLHFFNHYGYYQGTYYPREHYNAGTVVLAQASTYLDEARRLNLARALVAGAFRNMAAVVTYYANRSRQELAPLAEQIDQARHRLDEAHDVRELMGYEGDTREQYYAFFDAVLAGEDFTFGSRSRRPPSNRLNALVSFLNSMCYILALSQIYRTHLDPRIGYLHETNFRRFSLNLDLAEIFKPILVDRLICSLINRSIINKSHFMKEAGGIYLNEKGRKAVLKHWEERMQATIEHKQLKRNVSYRRLVRMEAYKIEKHILGDQEYSPFVTRW
ncbi:MAG: type I-B CRISPR-associated endonuclease Cas1b [Synergistales bacterium]|nr:type I-B CRISPR-associated endonuclease Cas1b [Synergistales bacterium]